MILGINPFFDDFYCYYDYKYQPIGILSVLATLRCAQGQALRSAGYDVAFLDAVTKRRQQTRQPKELIQKVDTIATAWVISRFNFS